MKYINYPQIVTKSLVFRSLESCSGKSCLSCSYCGVKLCIRNLHHKEKKYPYDMNVKFLVPLLLNLF